MYKSVLEKTTINNIGILNQQDFIKSFYLAGGTACAIHLGHRISNDLDFFSEEDLSPFIVKNSLQSNGHFLIDYSDSKTLIGRFNKTKISFFEYKYPLIRKTHPFINLNISSLEDLACMKIDAISSRGSKRDFVDLYFILKNFAPGLKTLFKYFEEKYGKENYNIYHIYKSLVYFDDAERDPELNMLVKYSWKSVKNFFIEQIKKLSDLIPQ